ncbi:MAG: S8/S53 family peptidase [Sphingomonadales bacterium]|nr:S8/S53 family peptidase [Sphingomonadales bacterium]MDE2171994.1 S8/S53 family peptidase [Sphingomonadales bacterium]
MAEQMQPLAGSHRDAPAGMQATGRVAGEEQVTVSLYLKPIAETTGNAPPFADRASLRTARSTEHADDLAAVSAFAAAQGLEIAESDPARRLVRLTGPAAAMEQAFGTKLHHYEGMGRTCRARHGALHLPAALAERVTAVLGLDTRPIATPKIVPHRGPTPPAGFLPTDVARLYGFDGVDASGQCIGIIELGGGYTEADNQAAFKAMALPVPTIVAVGVDGADNAPGDANGADGEVALDIQVAGGVAPGAKLAVYFAPNTDQGFVDAITRAIHDQANAPCVLSISWGSAESGWTGQAIAAMGQAFKDAAQLGVTVCAASGDGLATDGVSDGKAHVDYPASDPFVLGCGGTKIVASADRITHETVWNSNGGGTGGGVSTLFALPTWQQGAGVPSAHAKSGGRGVPDVAGNADPDSGYRIITDGQNGIIGGTSAVAPLWAGIIAGLNAARKTPLGQIHAQLYGDAAALRDIVSGNNKSGTIGFEAGKGWDPCTGLGSPDGDRLKAVLDGA